MKGRLGTIVTAMLASATLVAAVSVNSARADYTVTFSEAGSDVIASGSGTIDLNGLTFVTSRSTVPQVAPTFATEATGAAGAVDAKFGAWGRTTA
jgi:hypothetical protein